MYKSETSSLILKFMVQCTEIIRAVLQGQRMQCAGVFKKLLFNLQEFAM